MTRDLKAVFELKKSGELFYLLAIFGTTLLAVVLNFIIGGENLMEDLPIFIAYCVGGCYCGVNLFLRIFIMADEVPKGLTFGMTRRKIFIYSRIVDALEIIILAFLGALILPDVSNMIFVKGAFLVFGLFMWIEGIAGNNVIRYGKSAYWVYYIAVMVVIIVLPRLLGNLMSLTVANVYDHIFNPVYNQTGVWLGIIAFVVVGMVVNWITFRKLAVRTFS